MRVLVIADPHIPVPPQHYGGAERIVATLCNQLTQCGHQVDLLAGPGSRAFGNGRIYFHRAPNRAKSSRAFRKLRFQWQVLLAAKRVDVVINFGRLDYLWALTKLKTPLAVVFQNPALQSEIDWILARRSQKVRFVGISRAQMNGLVPRELIDIVQNVTDLDAMAFQAMPADPPYLAFLGRLTANKGVHLAIAAARAARMRLVIAGNVSETEPGAREYFETHVKPELRDGVEWIGPVNDLQKAELLGGATALLFPILWNEPFGIVMVEALACGCPVIAWRNGSAPEVIIHGKTGFVVESLVEMSAAIGRITDINRADCRRDAEMRFSAETLINGYEKVFERLLAA